MPTDPFERGLPASVDAERSILGAILLDNHAFNEAAEKLRPADFSLDSHQRIFARCGELMDANRAIDIVTLAEELSKRKEVQSIGGVAYLASLTEGLPRRLSIEEYVRIVKDKSLQRQLITALTLGITRAADQSEEAAEVLSATEADILAISEQGITRGFQSIAEIVQESFGTIDNLYSRGGSEVTGLRTYFNDFDVMTCGLQKQELIILAARPSMGKTALALDIARQAAVMGGKVVAIFSLEMSSESLVRRLLSAEAHIDSQLLAKGFLPGAAYGQLNDALSRLLEASLKIDDTAHITLTEMRAKARRLKHTLGALDLIVVDYLQLMSSGQKNPENRTQEVSAISRGLKALAKEMEVPVLALSQLSRASEQRGGDKKPLLSDLRESGSIEQDADVVTFIHRDSYYNRDEEVVNPDGDVAELIIAKQRNGPTGTVKLTYLPKCTSFLELNRTDYEGYDGQ